MKLGSGAGSRPGFQTPHAVPRSQSFPPPWLLLSLSGLWDQPLPTSFFKKCSICTAFPGSKTPLPSSPTWGSGPGPPGPRLGLGPGSSWASLGLGPGIACGRHCCTLSCEATCLHASPTGDVTCSTLSCEAARLHASPTGDVTHP